MSLLIFAQDSILIRKGDTFQLPPADPLAEHPRKPDSTISLADDVFGRIDGTYYHEPVTPPEEYQFTHLRNYAHGVGPEHFSLASRIYQLLFWDATHKYCGFCGKKLLPIDTERKDFSKSCGNCGLQVFPQIAPAIIIAVLREGKLLLGHNVRFPEGLYSLIAGFMEPGETIEECARREVFEETGIRIGNIRYFGSQPWPFPHSLMIGLIGEYAEGDIVPDGEEITDARWFTPRNLPNLPGHGSISRKIIDWYIKEYNEYRT